MESPVPVTIPAGFVDLDFTELRRVRLFSLSLYDGTCCSGFERFFDLEEDSENAGTVILTLLDLLRVLGRLVDAPAATTGTVVLCAMLVRALTDFLSTFSVSVRSFISTRVLATALASLQLKTIS